jgi:ApbE superfamily uncharacterized protein (UPF0280 family)
LSVIKENESICLCENGTVLVDKGPMSMSILVFKEGSISVTLGQWGAKKALSVLEILAGFKQTIAKNIGKVEIHKGYPRVLNRMISSVKRTGDQMMTPKAAVAGAISDEVADLIFEDTDVSKVIVNNGGDIALRIRNIENATVGIITDLSRKEITHKLLVNSFSNIGGVATSGMGGRSFTKGIASAAVAVASTACLADAAATLLGNTVNVDDPAIERQLAEEIYPGTDIPGQLVTTRAGNINQNKIKEALEKGLIKAKELQDKGMLFGALLALKGKIKITDSLSPMIRDI